MQRLLFYACSSVRTVMDSIIICYREPVDTGVGKQRKKANCCYSQGGFHILYNKQELLSGNIRITSHTPFHLFPHPLLHHAKRVMCDNKVLTVYSLGTYMTIDICREWLESGGDINLRDTVSRIRSQRAFGVQTPEQYQFCLTALREVLKQKEYHEDSDASEDDCS